MGLSLVLALIPPFLVPDIVVLIGLGAWLLRPSVPDIINLVGLAKVLLFLVLGAAAVIALFFTCGSITGRR